MTRTSAPDVYSPVMKTVHWATVLLVLGLLCIGWTMNSGLEMPRETLQGLFIWHKSLGIVVLALTLFRLAWRLTHRMPVMPPGLRPWEALATEAVHKLLYLLLLLQTLSGWCLVSLASVPFRFFGLFPMPRIPFLPMGQQAMALGEFLENIHGAMAGILAILIVLHAGAALKHHFLARDAVLLRMAPRCLGPLLQRLRGEH